MGAYVNAQHLRFMEKLTGFTHEQAFIDILPYRGGPSNAINQSFIMVFDALKAQLIIQAGGSNFFNNNDASYNLAAGDLTAGTVSASAISGLAVQASSLTTQAAREDYWEAVVEVLLQVKTKENFTSAESTTLDNAIKSSLPNNSWDYLTQTVLAKYPAIGTQGTEFSEYISGTEGGDTFNAMGGDDVIYGRGGDDVIHGNAGKDQLFGNAGNDYLAGGPGDDVSHANKHHLNLLAMLTVLQYLVSQIHPSSQS